MVEAYLQLMELLEPRLGLVKKTLTLLAKDLMSNAEFGTKL